MLGRFCLTRFKLPCCRNIYESFSSSTFYVILSRYQMLKGGTYVVILQWQQLFICPRMWLVNVSLSKNRGYSMNYSFLISDIISMQKPQSFKWWGYKIWMEEKNQKALHNSLVSLWSFMVFLYLYEHFSFTKPLRLLRTCDFSPFVDFNTQTNACMLTVPSGATW